CRVLKRDVEKYVLNKVVEKARELGKSKIIGEYLPTPKNALVKEHYKDLGFEAEADRWVLDTNTYKSKTHFIQ
ncbi:MAG: hypothetical protein AAGD28_25125, partial [Bacteroidota bacterium]